MTSNADPHFKPEDEAVMADKPTNTENVDNQKAAELDESWAGGGHDHAPVNHVLPAWDISAGLTAAV
ncbi:MAG: hypothetical protein HON65_11445, partial [Rhodospirillales bacterium]|nr:hypothetical protein [Rhodospirillales bacterium]